MADPSSTACSDNSSREGRLAAGAVPPPGLQAELLTEFLTEYPFQPATAFWRAIEIGVVLTEGGLPDGRGLDLGCGDGRLTQLVLKRTGPRQMVGLDPDPEEVRLARVLPIYESVYASGPEDLPEPPGSFDFAFSNSVLEHIADLEPVLGRVAELLKPGGEFIFTVPAPTFHTCLRGPLMLRRQRQHYLDELDRRLHHLRYWSGSEWTSALADHGLNVVRLRPYMNAREVRRWESISRLTAGVLYALWAGRARPITIQRTLGMRSSTARMPAAVARLAGSAIGWGRAESGPGPYGCLLVRAVKSV